MAGLNEKTRFNLERAQVLLFEPHGGPSITGQILSGFGVTKPRRCSSLDAALQIARSEVLDLVVCDGAAPDGAAYDFVQQLRRSDLEPNRYSPAIILAGHTPRALIEKARNSGANFVVAKPVAPRVLLERIFWIAQENRPFVELEGYVGPDRRFKTKEPPDGVKGRRRNDNKTELEVAVPDDEAPPDDLAPLVGAAS